MEPRSSEQLTFFPALDSELLAGGAEAGKDHGSHSLGLLVIKTNVIFVALAVFKFLHIWEDDFFFV